MSAWNGVLQAVHSSLIDELNERFPDDKLELGLPKRFDAWAASPNSEVFLYREVFAENGGGIAALGTREAQDPKESRAIFDATVARATKEFSLRRIDARFGKTLEAAPRLSMTIWLPIRIPSRKGEPVFDLAVGI